MDNTEIEDVVPLIAESNFDEQTYLEIKLLNENFTKFNDYILQKDKLESIEITKKEEEQILIDESNLLKETQLEQSEIDFRNSIVDSLTFLNANVTNLNEKTFEVSNDHFSNLSSINSNLQVLSTPVPATEQEQTDTYISNMSDIGIVAIVYVGVPVYILWKMFSKLLYQLV